MMMDEAIDRALACRLSVEQVVTEAKISGDTTLIIAANNTWSAMNTMVQCLESLRLASTEADTTASKPLTDVAKELMELTEGRQPSGMTLVFPNGSSMSFDFDAIASAMMKAGGLVTVSNFFAMLQALMIDAVATPTEGGS